MNEKEEALRQALLSLVPAGTLHLLELLKVAEIRLTRDCKTVTVYGNDRPVIAFNPDFLRKWCKSDEHLLMILMHELYHLIYGHGDSRFWFGFADHYILNLAFDALINATLCRAFKDRRYTSLFSSMYRRLPYPYRLLAPPGRFARDFHKALYGEKGVTYMEAYWEFSFWLEMKNKWDKTSFRGIIASKIKYSDRLSGKLNQPQKWYQKVLSGLSEKLEGRTPLLLGSHGGENKRVGQVLANVLTEIASSLPSGMLPNIGRGPDGKEIKPRFLEMGKSPLLDAWPLRRLLMKAGLTQERVGKSAFPSFGEVATETFIPSAKDRMYSAKRMVYGNPLLYSVEQPGVSLRNEEMKALVYLDVSESVFGSIREVASLLKGPYRRKECKLYAFSTVVRPLPYGDLVKGIVDTTGGTNINCVFAHYFSLPVNLRPKKILILTDGDTGYPSTEYVCKIKNWHIEFTAACSGARLLNTSKAWPRRSG